MVQFEVLFKPLTVKGITLRNRIVLPPMNTNFAEADGSVNERFIRYYVERGKGGAGLLIVSSAYVDPKARKRVGSLLLHEDRFIPRLKEFTDAVHATGAKILQQLNHNGRLLVSSKELKTAVTAGSVGPSPIPHLVTGECPRALTAAEIHELTEKFGQTARRAQKAGYDGVEIHGTHGYLINQFFSLYSNRRTDEYGGTLENRMRFPLEVYRRVRELTGEDFLISYRLNAREFAPVETPLSDVIALARRLEREGADFLHVSAGNAETPAMLLRMIPPGSVPQACYADLAAAVKKEVKTAVIAVGRINTPQIADRVLQEGKADLVATGRALIADPHWPEKALRGESERIRRCMACNQGCMERLIKEGEVTCLHNPEVGREGERHAPAEKKRVWIIGGGPGGMEAAVMAAARGHDVELYEKEGELGGQARLAALSPGKEEILAVPDYLVNELKRLNVAVYLNEEIKAEKVLRSRPDAVVLATGSLPVIPEIPGVARENVVPAWDVLKGEKVGMRVAMIGGGLVGLETALFLARRGRKVTLIEMADEIGGDVGPLNRARLKEALEDTTVEIRCRTRLQKIEKTCITVRSESGEYEIPTDTVVLAVGAKPRNSLHPALVGKVGQLYSIGDCEAPRKMLEAIHEAYEVAFRIG
jgi:2,4-dienoyl-CoA reductase-like NADH-dependent reductase (Old Yellow Enzyme family)/thioredoxin reductase